jgi:hypothetical protein
MAATTTIGTLRESSLHASLKALYARPGDELEALREGYVVDLVRPHELVEFQTGGFGRLRAKLEALLAVHPVRLVHPVPVERMLVRIDGDGVVTSRRRSPAHGCHHSLFDELVSIPQLALHPGLTFEVALVRVEEHRVEAPRTRRRRKPWRIADRLLVELVEARELDVARVLPDALPDPFTSAELAAALAIERALAQRIVYTLRGAGLVEQLGRRARSFEYRRAVSPAASTRTAASPSRR